MIEKKRQNTVIGSLCQILIPDIVSQASVQDFAEDKTEEEWGPRPGTLHLRTVEVTYANYKSLEREFIGD